MSLPPSLPRQMPEKLTTAPMSVRPWVRSAISRAISKSASWMRTVTIAVIVVASFSFDENAFVSAAGHRREERDLACARDRSLRLDMGVVDRGADHARLLERIGIALAARGQPAD